MIVRRIVGVKSPVTGTGAAEDDAVGERVGRIVGEALATGVGEIVGIVVGLGEAVGLGEDVSPDCDAVNAGTSPA